MTDTPDQPDPDERTDEQDKNRGAAKIERETNVDFHVTAPNEDDG